MLSDSTVVYHHLVAIQVCFLFADRRTVARAPLDTENYSQFRRKNTPILDFVLLSFEVSIKTFELLFFAFCER